MVSVANLRIESAMRPSVSERCVMGVGGIVERSTAFTWERRGVVVRARKLDNHH